MEYKRDDLYCIKGVREVKFNYGNKNLELDIINEVDLFQINGSDVIMIDFQITDDNVMQYLDGFNEGDLEISLDVKMWKDGSFSTKTKLFKNLNIVGKLSNYSYEEPTTWKYIFADCEYYKIRKELVAYLFASCKNDLTETLKVEQILLLGKIKECRQKGEFNTYKNLINALREITYLVNQEESRLINTIIN